MNLMMDHGSHGTPSKADKGSMGSRTSPWVSQRRHTPPAAWVWRGAILRGGGTRARVRARARVMDRVWGPGGPGSGSGVVRAFLRCTRHIRSGEHAAFRHGRFRAVVAEQGRRGRSCFGTRGVRVRVGPGGVGPSGSRVPGGRRRIRSARRVRRPAISARMDSISGLRVFEVRGLRGPGT